MPVEYKIISEGNTIHVDKQVTALLNQGWELQGPLITNATKGQYGSTVFFTQALVRRTTEGGGKKNMTRKNRRNSRK
jgi:hypothetical protein